MRRSLAWALAATVGLSLVARLSEQSALEPMVAVVPDIPRAAVLTPDSSPRGGSEPADMPAELPPLSIAPAMRDIFAERRSAQATPFTRAKLVTSVPVPLEPPPQLAPPLQVRYAGSMQSPDGQRIVYLARGNSSFEVHKGDRLDEGYVVEAIGEESLSLVYPPLGTTVTVSLPPSSAQ